MEIWGEEPVPRLVKANKRSKVNVKTENLHVLFPLLLSENRFMSDWSEKAPVEGGGAGSEYDHPAAEDPERCVKR